MKDRIRTSSGQVDWELPAAFAFGVLFVIVMIVLAFVVSKPTEFQLLVFRTVLALAAAGVAALIPGLLRIDAPFVKAGGALAVLILVYKFSPADLVVKVEVPPPPLVSTFRICSGEYERNCQPHDAYQYCGVSAESWAKARCSSYKSIRLDTRDGNKCGYTLDQVICTGPK
jgi:hypothetical protein